MKCCTFLLLFLSFAIPGWCARKITVSQLQGLLQSSREEKKSDSEIASVLQQVELSEQLTRGSMNAFTQLAPGPLTTEQLFVLEARSATLLPPSSDLPDKKAPDADATKAMLARAESYIARSYEGLPSFSAKQTTLRFQDSTDAIASSSGIHSGAKDAVTGSGSSGPHAFLHYINAESHSIILEQGAIKHRTAKDSVRWGANGLIRVPETDPSLQRVFREAQSSGTIQWSRWELIGGKPAAAFSFQVPRPISKLEVNVCCFPNVRQTGVARFYSSTTGPVLGAEKGVGGGVAGNFQTNTDWNEFRSDVPYHGRFYIDGDSGTVLRMVIEAEMKPSDVVHGVTTRMDYGLVKVGQDTFVVPVRSVVNLVVVPNGESGAGGYSTRTSLFSSEYSEYRPSN
ncbi:MAG: hypothetical protein JST28_15075 [Acidobacteria bacterium]|nr:hypothetical protein [Acidobacteriota bacterium]